MALMCVCCVEKDSTELSRVSLIYKDYGVNRLRDAEAKAGEQGAGGGGGRGWWIVAGNTRRNQVRPWRDRRAK